jgi:hypothetical protein
VQKEKILQKNVRSDLKKLGAVVITITPGVMTTRSTPDTFFTLAQTGGIWLELKREESLEPDPAQLEMIRRLNAKGSKAFTVRSWEQWLDLKKVLSI